MTCAIAASGGKTTRLLGKTTAAMHSAVSYSGSDEDRTGSSLDGIFDGNLCYCNRCGDIGVGFVIGGGVLLDGIGALFACLVAGV